MPHQSTHSVMFHHFHDAKHEPAQGSLDKVDFKNMINWLDKNYSLLGANDYKSKLLNGKLQSTDICLSFDDALKCQYDIAVPVMKEFSIDAFFFVYSSAFSENPDLLEVYRYFRTSAFNDIDEFYSDFFEVVEQKNALAYSEQKAIYTKLDYLSAFPFYTENDKWFRYIRDQYLNGNEYCEIMNNLMRKKEFDLEKAKNLLWMTEDDLKDIDMQGHIIGLHSYSHPTQMSKLNKAEQELEYKKNHNHLTNLLGKSVTVMSHPCGDYNKDTLEILSNLGIEIGFRSSMSIKNISSALEIPRDDHTNIFMEMRK